MVKKIVVGALETNCWIVPLDGDTVFGLKPAAVIDPGADPAQILSCLDRDGLYAQYILLTHGHFDHIAAVSGLCEIYKGKGIVPKVAIGKDDACYLGADARRFHDESIRAAMGNSYFMDQFYSPTPAADIILNEGDTVAGFKVLHLPGHSEGSVGFYDEKNLLLFGGDTLFKNGMGRTDLPGGSWNKLEKTLRRLFSMDGSITVFPGHGPPTTIRDEAGVF
ncbi:MBL fold hydrolase [Spirochaetia bacterium]|nr:MBL fold hydrolase [Spirochaetia bacterium]